MAVTTGPPLYPGTVYPGTDYPGGGSDPQIEVLYSTDDASVSTPSWQYVPDATLRGYTVDRGRGTEMDTFDAGHATITLDNRDRLFDPFFTAGLTPMNRWWIRVNYNGEKLDRFKGYADSYALTWPNKGFDSQVVVNCSDELKILNLSRTPAMDPPDAGDYQSVAVSDQPAQYWGWRDSFVTTTRVETEQLDTASFQWGQDDPYGSIQWDVKRTAIVEGPGWRSTGSGYGQSSDTPILGNWASGAGNYGSLLLDFTGTANQLTSTDAAAGDMQQSTKGTWECWFKKTANPGANQGFWVSPEVTGVAQRLWFFQHNTTGTVSAIVRVAGGGTQTVTSGALNNGQWYHLCAVRDGTNLIFYVNGASVGQTGSTLAWEQVSTTNLMLIQNSGTGTTIQLAEMAVYPGVGLSPARVLAHYTAATGRGFTRADPGVRTGAVLDTIDSGAPRSLQTGSREMTDTFMQGLPALAHIQAGVQCEAPDGLFFASRDGTLTFLDAAHRTKSPYDTVQMTFDDDGTDSQYLDTNQDYSDAFIVNTWNVSIASPGKIMQTATDAASKDRYFERAQNVSDVPLVLNTDAATIAAAYLAKYKDPMPRVPNVSPNMGDPDTCLAALHRDLADKVVVNRRPLGGGSVITQTAWIQQISEQAEPGAPLQLVFGVSPQ